jgi:hypothetical protein
MVPLPVAPSRDLINEIWERCARDEGRIDASTLRNLQEEFQDGPAFGPLVVGQDNVGASIQVLADNYRKLVKMLRNAGSIGRKLQLLAMWLRQEGILTPREFLPRAFRKKCIKDVLNALGMQHHDRVRRGSRAGVVKPAELRYALAERIVDRLCELGVEYRSESEGAKKRALENGVPSANLLSADQGQNR